MSHHSRSSISCELNFHHDEPNDTDTDTLTLTLTDPDPDTDDHDSEFIRESIFDGLFDTRYGIEHDIYEEPQLGNNDIPGDIEQGIDEPQLGNNQVGEMELDIEDEEAMNPSVEATIPGHFNIILEPQDIDSRPEVADYPGNISLQRIVQPFLLRYGRATRVNERNSIVFAIHALVVSPTNRPSSRFLVPGSTSGVNIYCREATLEEIVAKIEEVIRSHFNMVPTPNDVLFGRGQPIRDHPGNRLLRDFIDHRRHQYFISNNIERQAMIQLTRDIITSVGGRFLLPYNGTPFNGLNGCIPADEPSIRKKIRDLYREKRNEDDILIAKPRPPDEDPPLIMAHHLPTALPTSMMSSTPLPIDDFKDQETIQKEIPPHFNLTFSPSDVFIGSGQSIQDYPGNRTLQDFIDHRRLKYFVSNQNERHDMIQLTRDTIKRAGGRFLFLYHGKPFTGLCGCILADEQSIQKTIQDLYCRKTNDDGYPEEDLPGLMDHHVSTTLPTSITSSSPSSITYTDDQETVQTETEISPPVVNINHGSSVSTISGIVPEASEEASTIGNSLHLRRCTMVNIHHVSSVSTISGVVSEASKQAGTVDNPFHLRRDTCAKIFLGSVAIVVLLAVAVAFTSSQQETSHFLPLDEKSLTLRSILKRERLTCGIINQERYSAQDLSIAPWTGFEVDLCRAVGAGIFGKEKFAPLASRSSEPVEYRILEARERFVALDNLTVDLLLADTPQTMERNVYEVS